MKGNQQRRRAESRGHRGEALAALFLRAKGYRIRDRRYRTPAGEIDLVAQRGRQLVFVEVKTRSASEAAETTVTDKQRQRIARAAEVYLQRNGSLGKLDVRFDLIVIGGHRWPRHIADAWRPGGPG